jgi:hypothetical protein
VYIRRRSSSEFFIRDSSIDSKGFDIIYNNSSENRNAVITAIR